MTILDVVANYCQDHLSNSECSKLPFHSLQHTLEVVERVKLIAQKCSLSKDEMEPVLIAAWFHDTGYSSTYVGHEEESARLAEKFLSQAQYDREKIKLVVSCVHATKMPQNPMSEQAEILCDADIFHISTPDFFFKKLLLRREWELILGKTYSDQAWHELNLAFLQEHHFFTSYSKEVGKQGKRLNIEKVKMILQYY